MPWLDKENKEMWASLFSSTWDESYLPVAVFLLPFFYAGRKFTQLVEICGSDFRDLDGELFASLAQTAARRTNTNATWVSGFVAATLCQEIIEKTQWKN